MKKMKNKRKIVTLTSLILVVSFLSVTVVTAAPRGGPLEELWNAIFGLQDDMDQVFNSVFEDIDNLQTQIDEIELLPGPQGEQGEPGLGFPQAGTISIPSAQFIAERPSVDTVNTGNTLSYEGVSGRAKFYAGVQLPDGATLTDVSVQWYDSGPNRNDLVVLRDQLDGGAHHICLISSSGDSGLNIDSQVVIPDFALVDNSQNAYYVLVDLPASVLSVDYVLYKVFIEYEFIT